MQQFIEFAGNHPMLVGGFVAVLITLLVSEFMRRGQGFRSLTPSEAVSFMNQDGARVIDVSPVAEYNKGHIIGARNVPMSRIKSPDPELEKLFPNPILITCRSGQTATHAASALIKAGASDVAVAKGGMMQWNSDNYPVTRG
jgi:rhodanese-related sulfurtransferase